MKHIILVRTGDFGDNARLNLTGIAQMEHIADTISRLFTDIDPSHAIILSSGTILAQECADVFFKKLLLTTKIEVVEFLQTGTHDKPKQVCEKIVRYSKRHPIVIAITQKHNLKELPEQFVKTLETSHKQQFLNFAYAQTFEKQRGSIISFDDRNELHGIRPT